MADISGAISPEGWRVEIEMKPERGAHRNKKTLLAQKRWGIMIKKCGAIYITAVSEFDACEQLEDELLRRRAA